MTWRRAAIITPPGSWTSRSIRKPCPLVKPAAGKKEGDGEVVCQVSKVAAAILAQLAQELSQLRGGVVTQLGFLGREFGSRALGERICGAQDVIEQREGRFNQVRQALCL